MMRLLPTSMAGRTTMVLIAGLLLILAITIAVSSLTLLDSAAPRRSARLLERIVTLTAIVNGVPAAVRPNVLSAIDHQGLEARWTPHGADMAMSRDWGTARLERRLRLILGRLGVGPVFVGHARGPSRGDGRGPVARRGALLVRVQLADGTWLGLAASREWHNPEWLIKVGLIVAVVGLGIIGLAVWVARRVVAPLGRFAAAASRFGTDVGAPPLSESGPSEIKEAARAFNLMQWRIRRYVEERMHLLAAISHDLRTPITRLRLRAEFIGDPEQRRKALADLDEMQAMLEATLSFSRDEAGAEARTKLDLGALLQSLCDDLADAGQRVSYAGPSRLTYDCRPVALRRAFANLIDNAATYGHEATVTLAQDAGDIQVTVADRGPGIPEDMREKVFAPFFRLEQSRSRETGGTGLGLAVARTIVQGHGGDITLSARPGGGLAVRVTLPRTET